MQILKKLLFLLTSYELKHAGLLLIMVIIMAFLEMIGVASILPFMAVLTNPSLIETNTILIILFQASSMLGVENSQQFLFFMGVLTFIILITSLSFKALTTYLLIKFIRGIEYSLSTRLVKKYLYQPYSWFLNHHSADLTNNILSETHKVINLGLKQLIELISKSLVTITLVALLIIADPKLTFIICSILGGAYLIIYYFLKDYLNRIGQEAVENNKLRFRSISEIFGASKEIKFKGLEEVSSKNFSNPAKIFAHVQSSLEIISHLPRLILEIIIFGGILLLTLFIISKTGNLNNALPIISLYAFAGYRLMPAIQGIYASYSTLTFVSPLIHSLHDEFKNLKPLNRSQDKNILKLNEKITLRNISYIYPNSSMTALKNINLIIPARKTIGLIGPTGSGKTTIVDIILGLLQTQKGTLEVDGMVITQENSRAWQKSIGYVPQHIYLADDTIAANIAFGVELKDINQAQVEKVAKISNLHTFVQKELPNQYQTITGERGIRLSGGQRQRIGISRALYHNPEVLILDEATSALDNETEKIVMDALNNLNKNITTILIAHRLNTLKKCDIIFKLENGQIVNFGKFSELIDEEIKKIR